MKSATFDYEEIFLHHWKQDLEHIKADIIANDMWYVQEDHREAIHRELGVEIAKDDEEDEEEQPGGFHEPEPLSLSLSPQRPALCKLKSARMSWCACAEEEPDPVQTVAQEAASKPVLPIEKMLSKKVRLTLQRRPSDGANCARYSCLSQRSCGHVLHVSCAAL